MVGVEGIATSRASPLLQKAVGEGWLGAVASGAYMSDPLRLIRPTGVLRGWVVIECGALHAHQASSVRCGFVDAQVLYHHRRPVGELRYEIEPATHAFHVVAQG